MCQQNTSLPYLFQQGDLRLNVQSVYTSKSNALAGDDGPGAEHEREFRPSVKATYGIADWLSASIQVPLAFKRIEAITPDSRDRQHSSGLGDAEVSAVWTAPVAQSGSRSYILGLACALKVPTGINNARRDGERLDEHLQSGTGSYDWQGGISMGQIGTALAFHGSLYFRRNGMNSHLYHYGNALLYNAGIQGPITSGLMLSAQINGRFAKQDQNDGAQVANTGGSAIYLTPGIRMRLQQTLNLLVGLQIPAYLHLNGTQTEKAVLDAGFSWDIL